MFDEDSSDASRRNEEIHFFEEVKRLATREDRIRFTIMLLSGDHVEVEARTALAVLKSAFIVYASDGSSVTFPTFHVCAVRIVSDE